MRPGEILMPWRETGCTAEPEDYLPPMTCGTLFERHPIIGFGSAKNQCGTVFSSFRRCFRESRSLRAQTAISAPYSANENGRKPGQIDFDGDHNPEPVVIPRIFVPPSFQSDRGPPICHSDRASAASEWRNLWGSEVASRPFDDALVDDQLITVEG
jgi:hypothetical protein